MNTKVLLEKDHPDAVSWDVVTKHGVKVGGFICGLNGYTFFLVRKSSMKFYRSGPFKTLDDAINSSKTKSALNRRGFELEY